MNLSDLISVIEEEAAKNVEIQQQISETQKECVRMQTEDLLETKENFENLEDFEDIFNQLPNEHKDIINETINRIEKLRSEFDDNKNQILIFNSKIDKLIDAQNEGQIDLIKMCKSESMDSDFKRISENEISFYEEQINDLTTAIKSLQSQIKKSESALTEQLKIEENLETRGNGKVDTMNQIKDIDAVITKTTNSIESSITDIVEIQNWMADDEENYNEEKERIEKLYGCDELHDELNRERRSVDMSIAQNKNELEKIERRIFVGEKRYKRIANLPKKKLTDEVDDEISTPELYEELKIVKREYDEKERAEKKELDRIREEIKGLEKRKELLKRNFEVSQVTLKPILSLTKENINTIKAANADKEEKIIEAIKQIKTKAPTKIPVRKSAIPKFKPKKL